MDDIAEVRDRDAGLDVKSKRAEIAMHVPAISVHNSIFVCIISKMYFAFIQNIIFICKIGCMVIEFLNK